MLSVGLMTLLIEQRSKPYSDAYLNAFCETCSWQILLFILYMLLLDSKLMPKRQEIAISATLMITNMVSQCSTMPPKAARLNSLTNLPRTVLAPSLLQMLVIIVFVDSWLVARIQAFVSRMSLITDTTDLQGVELAEAGEFSGKNPLHVPPSRSGDSGSASEGDNEKSPVSSKIMIGGHSWTKEANGRRASLAVMTPSSVEEASSNEAEAKSLRHSRTMDAATMRSALARMKKRSKKEDQHVNSEV